MTAFCSSEHGGPGCVYFMVEKQESQALNSWFCPEHYLKDGEGGTSLKVRDSCSVGNGNY